MSSKEFIDSHFAKSFLHLPGTNGKFSSLVPWNELNRILTEHRLVPPRLKLFQAGRSIPKEKYLSAPDKFGHHLQAAAFTHLLAQGATLILDAFDELYGPVRELAVALERIFRIYVQVNLYAGWRTDQGFLLHYDEHDTIILQVSGRKHWKVYRPTRLYPLEEGVDAELAEKPVEEPIWDGILEDGGLLYMPRGWWHVAYPVDEPTLHLTFGLRNRRGLDLLLWYANELKNCVEVRQDVPFMGDPDIQTDYLERIRKYFLSAWSDDLVERFMAAADAKASPRPQLHLPEAAMPDGITVRRRSEVRLLGSRRLDLSGKLENGNLKFRCSGNTLHCPGSIVPALETLNDGHCHPVEELIALEPTQEANLMNFLQALTLQGILTTSRDSAEKQGSAR